MESSSYDPQEAAKPGFMAIANVHEGVEEWYFSYSLLPISRGIFAAPYSREKTTELDEGKGREKELSKS